MRLVILSDIHVGPYKKYFWVRKCARKINHLKDIDAVFFPGDFVFGGSEKYSRHLEALKILKYQKKFAVLGNHDHDPRPSKNIHQWPPISKKLKELKIKELKNESYFWKEKGIWVLGIDDNYWGFHDLQKTFKKTDYHPKILLAHSPDIYKELVDSSLHSDIIITGHTHGGQVRIPLLGAVPFVVPTMYFKSGTKHIYQKEETQVIVSRGVGEVGPRVRFYNTPEILVLNIN